MDSLPTARRPSYGLMFDVASVARKSTERSQTHQPTLYGIEPEPDERIRGKRNNDLSLENTEPSRRNILIFGEVGVGKSSLINLIAGENLAVTDSGGRGCTLQSQEHLITLDGVDFALHDTAGLHEAWGNMEASDYLDAVYQAHALISRLERSGGINLLVLCIQGGRISITTKHAYNLFVEALCNRQVPVVIVVTRLEIFDDMEQWWRENEDTIKEYGLRSSGHACITTIRGLNGLYSDKYEQSRVIIRELLLNVSGENEEKASWVKRHMRSWLPPPPRNQFDASHVKRKLVKRCGFSIKDADLIVQKIEQSRRTFEDAAGEEQPYEEFSGSLRELRSVKAVPSIIVNEGRDVVKRSVAEDAPPQEPNAKAVLGVIPEKEAARKIVADGALLQEPSNVKASPRVVPNGGTGVTKNVAEDAPVQELGNVKVVFDLVSGKEATRTSAANDTPPQELGDVKSVPGVVPNRRTDTSKKSLAPGGVAVPRPRNSKVTGKEGHKPGESDRHSVAEQAKLERPNTR